MDDGDGHAKVVDVTGETVLSEEPTGAVCEQFPRNVDPHATVALAGTDFEETESTMIVDPETNVPTHCITASGDGAPVEVTRCSAITDVVHARLHRGTDSATPPV